VQALRRAAPGTAAAIIWERRQCGEEEVQRDVLRYSLAFLALRRGGGLVYVVCPWYALVAAVALSVIPAVTLARAVAAIVAPAAVAVAAVAARGVSAVSRLIAFPRPPRVLGIRVGTL
jgi:hypothetical protein